MIIFFHPDSKLKTPEKVDSLISAEFPDKDTVLHCHDTGTQFEHGRHMVDNCWVVPHCKWLIWKYRCHINVECIASIKAIKYIYKYVYKGHDRTTMEFGNCEDEVKMYLDACYVSVPVKVVGASIIFGCMRKSLQ